MKKNVALLGTILTTIVIFVSSSCKDDVAGPTGANPTDDTTWWQCQGFDPNDQKHFRVLYPNGGEVFKVGDTVRVRVCSENEEFVVEQTDKQLSVDGGVSWIPIFYDMDGPEIVWVIPSQLEDVMNARTVSTVSSSCLFRVIVYSAQGDISVDRDTTDAPFSIAAP